MAWQTKLTSSSTSISRSFHCSYSVDTAARHSASPRLLMYPWAATQRHCSTTHTTLCRRSPPSGNRTNHAQRPQTDPENHSSNSQMSDDMHIRMIRSRPESDLMSSFPGPRTHGRRPLAIPRYTTGPLPSPRLLRFLDARPNHAPGFIQAGISASACGTSRIAHAIGCPSRRPANQGSAHPPGRLNVVLVQRRPAASLVVPRRDCLRQDVQQPTTSPHLLAAGGDHKALQTDRTVRSRS